MGTADDRAGTMPASAFKTPATARRPLGVLNVACTRALPVSRAKVWRQRAPVEGLGRGLLRRELATYISCRFLPLAPQRTWKVNLKSTQCALPGIAHGPALPSLPPGPADTAQPQLSRHNTTSIHTAQATLRRCANQLRHITT